ncbi:spore coat protein GerQ [Ornithinibacillus californiensis]|uniref:spore coat protein GerQ n=1 Tax=Ornithinibacillus californiensis TaxID=161536 RepID=UPI00064DBAC3|nr:spore coat protein GerQ [Ornithinibacillus californiensis]
MTDNQGKSQHNANFGQQPYYYFPQSSPAYYPFNYRQFGFPQGQQPAQQQQQQQSPFIDVPGMLPSEQSYIENILRLNRGKVATVYMTFENNSEWNAKIFRGVVEAAGRDHIILSDPQTGKRYLLLMVYLDYVTFDEELNYEYPYGSNPNMATYNPR